MQDNYISPERAELTRALAAAVGMEVPEDVGSERALESVFSVLAGVVAEYRSGGDQIAEETRELLVSAGHGEYVAVHPHVEVEYVWEPLGNEELNERIHDGSAPPEERARAIWDGSFALAPPEGADLSWETVIRLKGMRHDLLLWLASQRAMLSVDPGGDDGTYDYWPSGVRLAAAVSAELGGQELDLLKGVVRDVIASKAEWGLSAEELNLGLAQGPWPARSIALELPYSLTTAELVLEPSQQPRSAAETLRELAERVEGFDALPLDDAGLAMILKAAVLLHASSGEPIGACLDTAVVWHFG